MGQTIKVDDGTLQTRNVQHHGEDGHTYMISMTTHQGAALDSLAQAAARNPWTEAVAILMEHGRAHGLFVEVMITKDGKPEDGPNGEAAYSMFEKGATKPAHVTHYRDGERTEALDYNEKGHVIQVMRFKDDYLNDGPKGEPSVEIFDDKHRRTYLEHNTHGKLNDTANGEAARQWLENKKVVKLQHYEDGEQVGETETVEQPQKAPAAKAKTHGM